MSRLRHGAVALLAFALVSTALISTALVLTTAAPAAAHISLRATDPIADATLPALPPNVRLTFSSGLTTTPKVEVLSPDGRAANSGPLTVDGSAALQPVGSTAAGRFTVTWQVTAPDGHILKGSFAFTVVGANTSSAATPAAPPTSPGSPADTATAGPSGATDDRLIAGDADPPVTWAPWALGGAVLAIFAGGGLLIARRRSRPTA